MSRTCCSLIPVSQLLRQWLLRFQGLSALCGFVINTPNSHALQATHLLLGKANFLGTILGCSMKNYLKIKNYLSF